MTAPLNLTKGTVLNLSKTDGSSLTRIGLALGWDMRRLAGNVDLDANVSLHDADGAILDTVSYQQLRSRDGSVQHTGDNTTGAGDGDDETIYVDLSRVPANIHTLVLTITSYSGGAFGKVKNAFARVDDRSGARSVPLGEYNLTSDKGSSTALIVGALRRGPGGWTFEATGTPANGKVASQISADSIAVARGR